MTFISLGRSAGATAVIIFFLLCLGCARPHPDPVRQIDRWDTIYGPVMLMQNLMNSTYFVTGDSFAVARTLSCQTITRTRMNQWIDRGTYLDIICEHPECKGVTLIEHFEVTKDGIHRIGNENILSVTKEPPIEYPP